MEALIVIAVLLILILPGVPVFLALSIASLVGFIRMDGWAGLEHLADIVFSRLDTYAFVAIPLFTLMAQLLIQSGAVTDLYALASKVTQRLRVGVGAATIMIATLFSAISGSSVATAATLATTSVPEMIRGGYGSSAAFGLAAAGGTLGILVPPSIALIVYGIVADVSISALFVAAILPATLLVGLFLLYDAIVYTRKVRRSGDNPPRHVEADDATADNPRGHAAARALALLTIPVVVMVGLYAGILTPSEAGAIGVVLALLLGVVIRRFPSVKSVTEACVSAARTSGMVFSIVAGAALFGHVLVLTEAPEQLLGQVNALGIDRLTFLLILMLCIFVLGMFLEGASITLVTTPLIIPVLDQLGIDRLWYGILLVINLEVSLISPPVGLNLMVLKGAANAEYLEVVRGVIPYIVILAICLALLIVFPSIATFLPALLR